MKKTFLISFILISAFNYAQNSIQGKIIDAETKLELPYVNIGIPKTNIGTVSNKDGYFNLRLNKNVKPNDSLQFSFIGYESKLIKISSFSNSKVKIEMTPHIDQLSEVVLSSKKPKRKILGRNHKGTGTMWYNFYIAGEKQDDRLGKEVGMRFNLKGDYRVNSLNFYIGQNEYNSIKFRLNVYRIENNEPLELLNDKNIIFDVENIQSDWFKVDLRRYDIYLKEELGSFAVTIQWLESKKKTTQSKFFSIPGSINPLDTQYYREKGMSQWKSANRNLSFYLEVDRY
ncbi:putative outer membrane protein [Psychroflexus gondwanensis ACAM 44]|jgi:hypothetical protein|uniref:Putative outer membrane protein n=1 Tax=Psychroflexus gondwanensis ACAM 44 TaxID=1189619 RepID=N1WYT9_9FLAO|nr:carboxypeptidase-like regulatory domain-containing protein [Psychroflexus gondwanensis]EMY82274.1 putative outer membrane protein [Psychroflexus gondwanensis ACAM 44]